MELTGFSLSVLAAAAGVAFLHTVLGPDHYLPFIVLARARAWSLTRTLVVTTICGLGHVASSVLLGGLGVIFGVAVARIEGVEGGRGDLAAWALVALGMAYAVWGIRQALRNAKGIETHTHHGDVHLHTQGGAEHHHEHGMGSNLTFWALFLVFVLGPCEPLIPLFVLPASRGDWALAAATAVVFTLVTLATMVGLTAAALSGARQLRLGRLERWSHTLAGSVIAASGLAILFLGL
ncbi:MAG: sulfite exporter TauE/SafE family protein [Thermoanaerobaculales bacterium]|nr:sulfite exporter TauE/SafE family protein [Thermoanaerobaculales bacterium]